MRYFIQKFQPLFIFVYKVVVVISVFLSVCLSDHNSGTPERICLKFWFDELGRTKVMFLALLLALTL